MFTRTISISPRIVLHNANLFVYPNPLLGFSRIFHSYCSIQCRWTTRWVNRQLKDPYVKQAHSEGMVSRAAFKLREIHDKHKLFKPNMVVVDLGSAPGGWSQVVSSILNPSTTSKSRIISVDILEMTPVAGCEFLQMDFTKADSVSKLIELLAGTKVDIVLSDMAPSYSGNKQLDHDRLMSLAAMASEFATKVLTVGGSCVLKISAGGTEKAFTNTLKQAFAEVKVIKPNASRQESTEMFVLAKGFKKTA